jgi:putative PEP-CTERM system histidine kinase
MIAVLGLWSHALAAALFGALAIWQAQREPHDARTRAMVVALAITALFSLSVALSNPHSDVVQATDHVRNLAWLAFMYMIWQQGDVGRTKTVGLLYGVIALIVPVQLGIDLIAPTASFGESAQAAFLSGTLLRMTVSIGSLVLVHNLYSAATPDARNALRLPLVGLAAMWIYDLNLYTIGYLSREWPMELMQLRGVALVLTAPIFALATHRTASFTVRLSRTMTFQSISLAAIGGYLMTMVLVTSALQLIGGPAARMAQVSFVFAASLAALILLPSSHFRGWFRVKVSKHLFKHRYDYRAEWLRFTETLGRPGEDALPLDARVIQALADILESPGGMLLTADMGGNLIAQSRWNWTPSEPPSTAGTIALSNWLQESGRVIELDPLRLLSVEDDEEAAHVPQWLLSEAEAWAIIPLMHFDRLAGVVVLTRPPFSRTLDWEDFDLLRVAGRQVASYLAEARGQEALSDVKRFDEFNRRFAFIMHDIKNLVSQLSLVTRNAEKHAGNPEFQADMIATLKNSTARMNDLLARLSQHNKGKREDPRPVSLFDLAERVAAAKRITHPIVVSGDRNVLILAEPARIEQALGHLVQNAMEASPATEPVTLNVSRIGREAIIDIIDRGSGMSASFINAKLFRPFSSTKEAGFGIGTFEARSIIIESGGQIQVSSREAIGTTFTIRMAACDLSRVTLADEPPEALVA